MRYEDLYNDFKRLFPEDQAYFEIKEKETAASVDDGMHVVFAMIVVPFLKNIVKESPDKAKKAFEFLEKMETDTDIRIAEIVEFSVLESLMDDDDLKEKYIRYMGHETCMAVESLEKWIR